jgi:hypothetical protein
MSKEYIIRSVSDFLSIPIDRLDACLAEFTEAVRVARSLKEVSNTIDPKLHFSWHELKWVDDDKNEAHISIRQATEPPKIKERQ